MSNGKKHDSGPAEGARRATEPGPESSASAGGGRWSAQRNVSVILELLRGADLESTSRKHRVTVATLTDWRERFLAGGEVTLKSRETGRRRTEPTLEVSRSQSVPRYRTAAGEDRTAGEWPPFNRLEGETMSRAVSPSNKKPYGVARVISIWELARSGFYAARQREQYPRQPMKRGPKVLTDEELVSEIRQILDAPVFVGEGYRKIWARLRHKGVRTSKDRVLRLLRQNQLLSPARQPEPVRAHPHEGTIVTESPDQMWGTDATATFTETEGAVTVFAAIDHCTAECVGYPCGEESQQIRSPRADPPGSAAILRRFFQRRRGRPAVAA